jgi:hypothetical protein
MPPIRDRNFNATNQLQTEPVLSVMSSCLCRRGSYEYVNGYIWHLDVFLDAPPWVTYSSWTDSYFWLHCAGHSDWHSIQHQFWHQDLLFHPRIFDCLWGDSFTVVAAFR